MCPPANPVNFAPSPTVHKGCFVLSSSGSPLKRHLKHPNGAQIDAGRFPSGSRSLMSTTAKAGELHSHRDFYLIGILKNPQFNPLDIAMICHKTMQWGEALRVSFFCGKEKGEDSSPTSQGGRWMVHWPIQKPQQRGSGCLCLTDRNVRRNPIAISNH